MPKQEYPLWMKILIGLMLLLVGWFVFEALVGDMDLAYTVTADGVQITHKSLVIIPAENRLVPFSDITEIELLDSIPKMRKVFGKDGLRTWVGDYNAEGYGKVKAYVLNTKWPAVVIKTEATIYIITPTNAAEFVRQVQARL
jgi:hypothetical protein